MTSSTLPSDCSLQFIGNATLLLRLGPFTLLTDPNFLHRGQRAYLGHGLVSKRRIGPALEIDELPPLDGIVLSHMHGDHWDRVAKRGLDHDLPVVTTPKAARTLERQGFTRAQGLQTWGWTSLSRAGQAVRITALPGAHAKGAARRLLPPVMGSLIEYEASRGEVALRIYISGDTLLVRQLEAIPARFPDIDVAVLHLGGTTLPGGLVVTMDARAGADLVELVRPGRAVPVHTDDYTVFRSPRADFEAEMARRGLTGVLDVVERGETRMLQRRDHRRDLAS
jgi:L-ascorbate metabolism protein UlaG (beta-lactamase superfamily)